MPICSMYGWYIYLQNWVVLFGQMFVRIFQHHGSHMGCIIYNIPAIHGWELGIPGIPPFLGNLHIYWMYHRWVLHHRPDIQPAVGWETGRISSAARGAGPGETCMGHGNFRAVGRNWVRKCYKSRTIPIIEYNIYIYIYIIYIQL